MTRRLLDRLTGDLFSEVQQPTIDDGLAVQRIRHYACNDDADRLQWWLHADRLPMRNVPVWGIVFRHVRAAVRNKAMALPARSVSEDSQRHRVSGAPLGIYGENAVTLEQKVAND